MIDKLKGAFRSWTIHFNIWVMAAIEALPMLQDAFPQLQPYIPANLYQSGLALLVVGNLLLRFRTSTSLAHK